MLKEISLLLFTLGFLGQSVQEPAPRPHLPQPPLPFVGISNAILTARVIQFDHFMSEGTSQGDLMVRTENGENPEFFRLRYAPDGWGFDAPTATATQLLPHELITDSNLVWTFSARQPANEEDKGACTGGGTYIQRADDGSETKLNPYRKVPGSIGGEPANPRSLHCLILQSWFADAGRLVGPCRIEMNSVAIEASFTAMYKFKADTGIPRNITKVRNMFLPDDSFLHCISHWIMPPMPYGYAEFRHERDSGWTSMTVIKTEPQKP